MRSHMHAPSFLCPPISYLLVDISISCETDRYLRHQKFAAFGVMIFPIGILFFFTGLVAYFRKRLPPDWWPAREVEESKLAYQKYRAKRTEPQPISTWKVKNWYVPQNLAFVVTICNVFLFSVFLTPTPTPPTHTHTHMHTHLSPGLR